MNSMVLLSHVGALSHAVFVDLVPCCSGVVYGPSGRASKTACLYIRCVSLPESRWTHFYVRYRDNLFLLSVVFAIFRRYLPGMHT